MTRRRPTGRLREPRGWTATPLGRGLIVVAAGCAGGLMLLALGTQYVRDYSLAREATQLEQRRRDLLAQNHRLRAEIQRLLTDDRYLERLAREQLGLVRPGEVELVIVPADPVHEPGAGKHGGASRADSRGASAQGAERAPAATRAIAGLIAHLRNVLERAFGRLWR